MAALPYMQLYVAEYLADTSHLNAAQHGAYLLLLMNYWQRGKPLPDSNDRLAIVARMSAEEWASNRKILGEFFVVKNECWTHRRVERDLLRVKGISNAGRVAGLASAKARKQKASNDRSKTVQRNSNQQSINRTEQIKTESTKATTPLSGFELPSWIDSQIWKQYEEMRRKIRKPMLDSTRELAVKKLAAFEAKGISASDVLNNSILNSYQGLFEPKTNGGTNGYESKGDRAVREALEIMDRQSAQDSRATQGRFA